VNTTALLAYVPVLHQGYYNLFCKCVKGTLYLLGDGIIAKLPGFDYLARKDKIRRIDSQRISQAISAWGIFSKVVVIETMEDLLSLPRTHTHIIMPDEDVSRTVANGYLQNSHVVFEPIFLRWHRDNVEEQQKIKTHRAVTISEFEKEIMSRVSAEGLKSFDWWRQVGAFIVKNGEVILVAHNQHLPDEQAPYVFGDPRSIFKKGIHIELSSADHAEAILVGEAARLGISLDGGFLYVTDFPCPPCAKLIGRAGIQRVYFAKGYAVLDGQTTLLERDIELVFVQQ